MAATALCCVACEASLGEEAPSAFQLWSLNTQRVLAWLPQYLQFVTEGGVEGEVTGGIQHPLLTRALCWAAGLGGFGGTCSASHAQINAEGRGVKGVSVFPCFQQSPVQEVQVAGGCWQ